MVVGAGAMVKVHGKYRHLSFLYVLEQAQKKENHLRCTAMSVAVNLVALQTHMQINDMHGI